MKIRNRLKYIKVILCVLLALFIFLFITNKIFFYRYVYFHRIRSGLYVSTAVSKNQINIALQAIEDAYVSNIRLWKDSSVVFPDIYIIGDDKLRSLLSKKETYATHIASPLYHYIIINDDGLNKDIIVHETVHAVLYSKLGWNKWYKYTYKVPVWFDEGLASQAGGNPQWNGTLAKQSLKTMVDYLKSTDMHRTFYEKDMEYNYALAKYVVGELLRNNKFSLKDFTDRIAKGNDFYLELAKYE